MEKRIDSPTIRVVNDENVNLSKFSLHLADCVIVTHDNKLLVQERPLNWHGNPGGINLFGGHVEKGENIVDGLVRELKEELGAIVRSKDIKKLGAITEEFTGHTELVHIYFWHDRENTITGCYEGEPRYYAAIDEALSHPKIMDYTRWALIKAEREGLLSLQNLN